MNEAWMDEARGPCVPARARNRVYALALVVLNKIDLVTSDYLDAVGDRLRPWRVLPISAANGAGVDRLGQGRRIALST